DQRDVSWTHVQSEQESRSGRQQQRHRTKGDEAVESKQRLPPQRTRRSQRTSLCPLCPLWFKLQRNSTRKQMSVFTNPASSSREQARAYTSAILDLLGDRNPMDVLKRTEAALKRAVRGLTP